ncbi:MAG TPA: polyphosphate kinase 1 [Candidatus Competibacteraceae bacterium]|nr:polyphosphate kinase 1 [Candidatus Competibacteraceae bacterium]MCP5133808.1 polyphosphate kinase 1 [Gammaproteobacteria bacterium]HPF58128.1 polyphosphate kinase 1 [Candidatus Competibacteraceae bacterium]HRY18117.1 polyphosphate kinase 1 [Candidatus Competibacteraceae bacterium]
MASEPTLPEPPPPVFDANAPEWYLNRELTWLAFNQRVLQEAQDERTPLLARVKFLAIVSSNLNEFFMKRIGGLKQQIGTRVRELSVDGRSPEQQLSECLVVVRDIVDQQRILASQLHELLKEQGIFLRSYKRLTEAQRKQMREYYLRNIFPLVTPQTMDPAHPFPFISNLSLNLLVTVRYANDDASGLARIKVPLGSGIERFLKVGDEELYVPLEDVMANNLDLLFPGMVIEACELFRVTRNAITERDEDQADDLLVMIESELRERKVAPIVRLEVQKNMDPVHRGMLAAELGLDEASEVFEVDGMMAMKDLFQVVTINRLDLHDPSHHPLDHPKLSDKRSIFHIIREIGPILLQHPYESFATSVERFLREASFDPKVLAIKMTLYRTSEDSKIIEYLTNAAQNGKQVTVVVELKARFDEAANIRWANRMEEAGIHVTYGVLGLKTHSKVILVVRRDYNGLRRYAHIGTGNYHAGTARMYSDLGLLTCDPVIGEDLTELFNYLTTGYVPKRNYRKLLPAPKVLKPALLAKIEREIGHAKAGKPALIQFKMNALEDKEVTAALYQASQAGVNVDLIVRDTCRLRPGIPGISENVRVISIVGRFLEHTRIFHFRNSGADEYFIGSADCMQRNLESRVEVVAPVDTPELQRELQQILDVQLNDRRSAWDMQPDGTYIQRIPGEGDDPRGSQQILIELAEKRQKEAQRLKKRKPKGIARRMIV